MNWLTPEEAIRSAFEYRWRGTEGPDPILITDFQWGNARVFEVLPGDWNDVTTWSASERPMSPTDWAEITAYIASTGEKMALGEEVMQEQGHPVRVRGYIKRQGHGWNATLDLDEVRRELNSDGSFDEEE
jgi:hypothetical protein